MIENEVKISKAIWYFGRRKCRLFTVKDFTENVFVHLLILNDCGFLLVDTAAENANPNWWFSLLPKVLGRLTSR